MLSIDCRTQWHYFSTWRFSDMIPVDEDLVDKLPLKTKLVHLQPQQCFAIFNSKNDKPPSRTVPEKYFETKRNISSQVAVTNIIPDI